MTKPDSTVELYDLVAKFTRAYYKRYIPNYVGDVRDLSSEIFMRLITPRGRSEEKLNMFDRYNPEASSYFYYVSVAVKRQLIDVARGQKNLYYYQKDEERLGDLVMKLIGVYEIDVEDHLPLTKSTFDEALKKLIEISEKDKGEQRVQAIFAYFRSVCNVIDPKLSKFLKRLHAEYIRNQQYVFIVGRRCPIVQLTEKSVKVKVDDDIVVFDRLKGTSRSSDITGRGEFCFDPKDLEDVPENYNVEHELNYN